MKTLDEFRNRAKKQAASFKRSVAICTGTGCQAYGCTNVVGVFRNEIEKAGLKDSVRILTTGCHGFCELGTIVVVQPAGIFYRQVQPGDVAEIVEKSLAADGIVERLLYNDPSDGQVIAREKDIPFYKVQKRLVFGNNGALDPRRIDDYLALDGYSALESVLAENDPLKLISDMKASGLRGRGGAGFPTGLKWELARRNEADVKFVGCNADEGDPGAYMDRSLLEGNPHSVIEGMIIMAHAINATAGFIYCRTEYKLAVQNLMAALEGARSIGVLGKDILGTGMDFDIELHEGAGAFVCGEETALIASMEGKRGMPRIRPPFPAEKGYLGKPTCINNVETLANVPWIVKNGHEAFAALGTGKSKGTKVFALTGKVPRTGLVEVEMGSTLRDIVCGAGGADPADVKAVQIGGPSGGCVPVEYLDNKVDYESLKSLGSIVGSGGMVVMDHSTCMVDVARYFIGFTQHESCGKCTFCRIGTRRMGEILEKICNGEGTPSDLDELENLAKKVKSASLCGLGQTAPNPVLTTLRFYRDEYEAHVRDKRCPALVCKPLLTYRVIEDKCTGCMACVKACPSNAIEGEKRQPQHIITERCTRCGACHSVCRFGAIEVTS